MRKNTAFRLIALLAAVVLLLVSVAGCAQDADTGVQTTVSTQSSPDNDIVVLFTNDVHCGVEDGIGYAGVAAYKKHCKTQTPYVSLVDCGDALQGDLIGAISSGEYIVDIMNQVGYDLAVLGNHEFDFGLEQLQKLIKTADATYLGANINYSGSGENKLSDVKPYEIYTYGSTKVAFIGLATPFTINSTTPTYFKENGEFVYSFAPSNIFSCAQKYVDECRASGADYVIMLTHLGNTEEYSPYSAIDLVSNTTGVDAVLDAHAHNVVLGQTATSKDGKAVPIASTGTKLQNIGKLTISTEGKIKIELISDYSEKDPATAAFINSIKSSYEERLSKVVATSLADLSLYDENGVRMSRNRETNIGNFCADAYRIVAGADIGFVNGGGVRDNISMGDVTYADIIAVHPFGNTLCMVEATGQEVLDALEISMYAVEKDYRSADGVAIGENGSFLHSSGIRFTVDTSIPSTVTFDENVMVVSLGENRRVCNVEVLGADGKYAPIDPNATYKVASHNYLLADGGCSHEIFSDNVFLIDRGMADYQMLIDYIEDHLGGTIGEEYRTTEGRITIK